MKEVGHMRAGLDCDQCYLCNRSGVLQGKENASIPLQVKVLHLYVGGVVY